jgi:hypothetical protein
VESYFSFLSFLSAGVSGNPTRIREPWRSTQNKDYMKKLKYVFFVFKVYYNIFKKLFIFNFLFIFFQITFYM